MKATAKAKRTSRAAGAWLVWVTIGAAAAAGADALPPADALRAGDRLFQKGQFEAAAGVWRRALESGRASVDLHNRLGMALTRLKRFREAEAEFKAAAALKPDEPKTLFNLGLLYLHEHDLARAERTLRRTLRVAAWYPQTHYHLALIAESQGRLDDAQREYVAELNVNPGCAKAWLRLRALRGEPTRRRRVDASALTLGGAGFLAGLVCLLAARTSRRGERAAWTLLLACAAAGQARAAEVNYDAYRALITPDALRAKIEKLCAGGSRVLGYPGCDRAAAFIESEFKRIGLSDVKTETFTAPVPIDQGAWVTVVKTGQRFRVYPLWPNLTRPPVLPDGGVTGNLIDAGRGDFSLLDGKKVEGSVALLDMASDDRYVDLRVLGVKAILFPEPDATNRGQAEFKFLDSPVNIPRFWVPKAAARVLRRLAKSGQAQVRVESKMTWRPAVGKNIYGYLPGRKALANQARGERLTAEDRAVLAERAQRARLAAGVLALACLAAFLLILASGRAKWAKGLFAVVVVSSLVVYFAFFHARRPSGEKKEGEEDLVVLEAYYDSMSIVPSLSPGAEQATGIATLLQLAEVFHELRPERSVLFLAASGHCEALAGVSNFMMAHCRDEKFRSRVTNPEFRKRFKDPIKFRLFIGLDLSSRTDRLGIFHEGHFTTLNRRPDLQPRRYFALYGVKFGQYAKRIAGQGALDQIAAALKRQGKAFSPEAREAALAIIERFEEFTPREVMRYRGGGRPPLSSEAVQTAIEGMLAAGLMEPSTQYVVNPERFPITDYTQFFERKALSGWDRLMVRLGVRRPVPRDLPKLDPRLKPVVEKIAEQKKAFAPADIEGVDSKLVNEAVERLARYGALLHRYTYHAPSFLENGITPVGGVIWQSFIPGLIALDSEVLVKMALPGVSFVSINDSRPFVDTPLDTPNRVNLANLTTQAHELACMLAHALNDPDVFPDIKVKLRDYAKAVRGQVVEFRIGQSLLPDYPVNNVLVVLRDPGQKNQWEKTFMGVRGAAMAITDHDGYFEHPFVFQRSVNIEAYKNDPATGEIMYAADRGPEGDGTYPLETPMDWRLKETRTVVFRCRSLDIYDLFDPRYLRSLDTINVLGPLDFAPLRYGYSELSGRGAAVCFEDGDRVKVIMGSGVFGIQYLLTNVKPTPAHGFVTMWTEGPAPRKIRVPAGLRISGPRARPYATTEDVYLSKGATSVRAPVRALTPGKAGNVKAGALNQFLTPPPPGIVKVRNERAIANGKDNPTGIGFPANPEAALFHTSELAARNMFVLNEWRIEALHRYGITNERLETLHAQAAAALDLARRARERRQYARYIKHVRAARGFEAKAYPDVRGTANDTVKGIIFYFALLLPFAYFIERLLFGFADIRKQIAAASGVFVLVFIVLRFVHPAFRLSTSPYIIFLAFVLLAMAVFVITIVVTKFNEQVAEMRRQAAKVHEADVGRLSASAAAFNLGISNMKKRKMRTTLTTVTLILLTFTVLSFTSVNTYTRYNRIPRPRRTEWYRLTDKSFAQLKADAAPAAVLSKLKPLKGRKFDAEDDLRQAVAKVLSKGELNAWWPHIRERARKPYYRGMLVRDRNWNYLEDIAYEYVFSGFTHEDIPVVLARRSWYMSKTRDGELHIRLTAADGKSTHAVAAVGMTPNERLVTRIDSPDYLLAGKWIEPGDQRVVILPEDMAKLLGLGPKDAGKARVTLFGESYLVKGILSSKALSNMIDLDGEQLSPVDLSAEEKDFDPNETAASLRSNATEIKEFAHLNPNGCVFVPYERVIELGGDLRSIAVKLADDADFGEFLLQVKRFMSRVGMTVFVSDGERVTAYSSMGLSSFSGLGNLFIPILIAALIVLNTMMGSVHERFREIGIYSSVGLAPVHIGALFLAESCVYAVVGAISGYLIGQVLGTVIATFDLLPGLTLNYSSLSAVASTFIVMAVVILSTLYPAKVASNTAVPDVTRKWQFPDPDGDDWTFDFPFTVAARQVHGLYVFLNNYFDGYKEESVGSFYTDNVEFTTYEAEFGMGYMIRMKVWLAPFDMGISQLVELRALPTEDEGITRIQVFIHRISGEISSWTRLNKGFLTEIRKQFLIWRTVPESVKAEYIEEGRRLVEEMVGAA